MDARAAAFKILGELESGPRLLETALARHLARVADPRQRALANSLVYGLLRHRARLDHLLAAFVRRPLTKLEPAVHRLLRLGAAEVVLHSTPDYAAVHAVVDLAKSVGLGRAAGLVNATLRALARGWRQVPLPQREPDLAAHLAVAFSHPRWLVERLLDLWPPAQVEAWLKANQEPAGLHLRANPLKTGRQELSQLLAAAGLAPRPLTHTDQGLALFAPGPSQELPGFAQGLWQAQSAASQMVAPLLGVRPGSRVLDICAGAGGKTGHLAALMQGRGSLLAVEPSPGRYQALGENLARLGIAFARTRQVDGRKLPPEEDPFDYVLIDAPCSGLGACRRRPDLRWRRSPAELPALARLQGELMEAGGRLLAPGGALLYATCTVLPEENQEVVRGFLERHPDLDLGWELAPGDPGRRFLDSQGFWSTLPKEPELEGFFAARLVRRG